LVLNGEYVMQYTDMYAQFLNLMKANVRILVFNGDVDTVCNAIGDEWFVKSFQLPVDG
jgi:Serine carboxypeptidase